MINFFWSLQSALVGLPSFSLHYTDIRQHLYYVGIQNFVYVNVHLTPVTNMETPQSGHVQRAIL